MSTSFDTRYVADLLGTRVLRVHKLALLANREPTSNSCKLARRGKDRRFEIEEISRLALAYWLFQAGLRGPFIASILADKVVCQIISPMTSITRIREEAARDRLLIAWGLNIKHKVKKWEVGHEGVTFVQSLESTPIILERQSCVIVPVGRLLQQLVDKILD
jgi:hypothetical protein